MGLIAALAVLRVHVLVVEVPGRPMLRLRAEAAVRARGWVLADTPADTDLLLVCGTPEGELAEAVARIWAQVPFPRARRAVRGADALPAALDGAARVLADDALQRREAAGARSAQPGGGEGAQHGAHHEHGEHGEHGMRMSGPGGIPLAGGEEDRDGLEMDVLHVPLGPVLPDWPAGLVADCVLAGDVVLRASARLLPAEGDDPDPADEPVRRLALDLDRAASILRLAGFPAPAAALVRAVDQLLAGADPARVRRRVRGVARLVRRSATLRWSLAREADVPARLTALLAPEGAGPAALDPASLAAALAGRSLASARLLAAAGGPVEREAARA